MQAEPLDRVEPLPLLIGVPDAARLLGVSPKTVKRGLASGEIPGIRKLGRRTLVSRAELEDWVAKGCPAVGRPRIARRGGRP